MIFRDAAFLLSYGGNDWSLAGRSFLLVFVCVLLFVGTYYLTRYISRARVSGKIHGNIYIVEVISVGVSSTVQLIKAGDKYVLIGVSKDRIVFLSEIDPAGVEIPEFNPIINKGLFEKYLQKFLHRDGKDTSDGSARNGDNDDKDNNNG